MTCYFTVRDTSLDVYDHEGTLVADGVEYSGVLDRDGPHGPYPSEALAALRDAMEGAKPSAYNQSLLADMASENIVEGTPPA